MYLIQLGPVTYERKGGGGFTLTEAMREVYGVGYAQVLREDGTVVVSDAGSSVAVLHAPTGRRGHGPHCKHCQQVEAYRLERDAQVRYGESLACGDEDFRPVTFKEWLVTSGQERRLRDEEWAAEWATA